MVLDEHFAGFDGISPTLEFRRSTGGNAGVADLRQRYLWGDGVDQLLANEQLTAPTTAGNVLWTLGDHLGTLRDLVDFNAGTTTYNVVNHRTFDVFGRISAESNSFHDVSFAWTGKYYDKTTQLSLHWNRWYDPALGKWVSEDPVGFVAGDPNLGRYVKNDPTSNVDSEGLEGVGHHYVNVLTLKDPDIMINLSGNAVDLALGTYSGPTYPHHRNGTFGGVPHPEYNQIVKDRLKAYMNKNGISSTNKMSADQMDEFIEQVRSGNTGDDTADAKLKAFNDDIAERRAEFKRRSPNSPDTPSAIKDRIEAGNKMRRRRGVIAGQLLGGAIGGLVATATGEAIAGLDSAANSRYFRNGVRALSKGDVDEATKQLLGRGNHFPNGGFVGEVIDGGAPNAGLRFQQEWLKQLDVAFQAEQALRGIDQAEQKEGRPGPRDKRSQATGGQR